MLLTLLTFDEQTFVIPKWLCWGSLLALMKSTLIPLFMLSTSPLVTLCDSSTLPACIELFIWGSLFLISYRLNDD